jgi:hypothetical protein
MQSFKELAIHAAKKQCPSCLMACRIGEAHVYGTRNPKNKKIETLKNKAGSYIIKELVN